MGLVTFPSASGVTTQRQIFTSSGTFTLPAGFGPDRPLWSRVIAVGGGGGGGQGFCSGGGGGGAVVVRDLGITGNLTVVVGAGGNGGAESSNGGRGSSSIVGNQYSTPDNLIFNPFMMGLYGNFDTTGWSVSSSGSVTHFRSDYSTGINQFYRQRFFDIADANNWQGRFKSAWGISIHSTSGDAWIQYESTFFNVTPGESLNYGSYTRSAQGNNDMIHTLDYYSSGNVALSLAQPTTFTNNDTSDRKNIGTATVPASGFDSQFNSLPVAKAKLRLRMRVASTNHQSQLFGTFVSRTINYCPWESAGNPVYWTGTQFQSYITRLNTTSLSTGQVGIVAGGGGGGGRGADEGDGGWMHYRFGGVGGHQGGFGSGWSSTGENAFLLGGDGGGAGSYARRDIFRGTNNTTPYSTANTEGFIGFNVNGAWRTQSWRNPTASLYGRWIAGSAGTSALQITEWNSSQYAKWNIEGGRPHASGYSAGGPGSGYYKVLNENPGRYHYNGSLQHFREQPYGNGGAGSHTGNPNLNTGNMGYMDYAIYGDWNHNGDPGIVVFEYLA